MIRGFAFPDVIYLLDATRWTLLLAVVATVGGGLPSLSPWRGWSPSSRSTGWRLAISI